MLGFVLLEDRIKLAFAVLQAVTFVYDKMVPGNLAQNGHVHAHQCLICCQDHIESAAQLRTSRTVSSVLLLPIQGKEQKH